MTLINLNTTKRNFIVFIYFTFLSFLFRFWSFFDSVIDHDESLYFLMAHSFLNGIPPYIEVWDNKPPGIFILFSFAILTFGNSITSIRILTCLLVVITSYFLYKIAKLISKNNEKTGLLAGILYLVFSLSNNGVAANAEILSAPFVAFAFYLLFKNTKYKYFTFFMIGFLLGLAMQIKYVVIMDFVAFLAIVSTRLLFEKKDKELNIALVKVYASSILGFILPFSFVVFYFITIGHFDKYFYATLIANTKYIDATKFSSTNFLSATGIQLYTNFPLYLCLVLSFSYIKSSKITLKDKMILYNLICWFSFTFVATLVSKRFIGHYYLQLLPPLCLISSYIIVQTLNKHLIRRKQKIFLVSASVLMLLITLYPHIQKSTELLINQYITKQNYSENEVLIANYIKAKISPSDYIYIVNYQPIIYYLVPAKFPTRYIFPSHLISYYSAITGIDPIQELNSIMAKKPVYVLLDGEKEIENNKYKTNLNTYLEKEYFLEKTIERVRLYKIKKIK